MSSFPLITHRDADSVIALYNGKPVTAARFLADVRMVSGTLPAGCYMLNACADRYHFMVGMAAALLAGKVSLLPSTRTPEMIRQLLQFAPDAFCLTDTPECTIALPQIRFPELGLSASAIPEQDYIVPGIDAQAVAAYVFTSGSTGMPVPHAKTWGALVKSVHTEMQAWQLQENRHYAIIGTVPPQHMYGLESTVLMVMQCAGRMVVSQSFYPADICEAVRNAPRPRILVSTPVHLRAVLEAGVDIPAADLVVSATAPLAMELATEVERAFAAPLVEIYGSTETGQIASRWPTQTSEWHLFSGIRFQQQDGAVFAHGGHVEMPTVMNDVIEIVDDRRFLLHGRTADLINIAGKRNSLSYLNLQLNAIPGVVDGAFFMPDESNEQGITRLAAFVAAPGLTPALLLAELRQRIDPVFLPRPLVFIESLPRNATGKLPREALQALLQKAREGAT